MGSQTAIVTGAAGSLGTAIVRGLRDRGIVIVALDRDAAGLAELERQGVPTVCCDLLDEVATRQAVAEIWDRHGPVSVMVNAVGLIHSEPLINMAARTDRGHSVAAWRSVIEVNLTAPFIATVNIVDRMAATRTRGVIINFSSLVAVGNAGQAAYGAAKAGVNAMTASWAKELGPRGIRFVAIAPGFVDVASTHAAMSEVTLGDWIRRTPLRRLVAAEAVVKAVVFAIESDHLTGKVIEIDGGLTL
jgi:3-oxoacyl-[acyl-carrier protein] reductase